MSEALAALANLRQAMDKIKLASPRYRPGTEPSAADCCRQLLDLMDWNIRQIAVFLGPAQCEFPPSFDWHANNCPVSPNGPLKLNRQPLDVTLDGNEDYTEIKMVPYVEGEEAE